MALVRGAAVALIASGLLLGGCSSLPFVGGESKAKEAGKWRLEGKDYLVAEGDVMHFRFNV